MSLLDMYIAFFPAFAFGAVVLLLSYLTGDR